MATTKSKSKKKPATKRSKKKTAGSTTKDTSKSNEKSVTSVGEKKTASSITKGTSKREAANNGQPAAVNHKSQAKPGGNGKGRSGYRKQKTHHSAAQTEAKSYPRASMQVTLRSGISQKLFRRQFEIINRLIYNIGILTRIAGNQLSHGEFADAADKIADMASQELDSIMGACQSDLDIEIARLSKVIADNGIDIIEVNYPDRVSVTAGLLHPKAGPFIKLLLTYDVLHHLIRQCWFGQILDEKQMLQGEYRWERRIKRTGTRIRQLAGTVKNGVRRLGQDDVDESLMPLSDKPNRASEEPRTAVA